MQKHIVHQIVGLALCATVLTGCEANARLEQHDVRGDKAGKIPFGVRSFTLEDGTKCASVIEGGITCNWKANP